MGFLSASDRENPSRPCVQVLPRDDAREHLLAIADVLAKALDTTVKIPGTSVSIGLDPLLGLIPGIGDALANLIGTIILGLATRLRVPRIVLARMCLNLLINLETAVEAHAQAQGAESRCFRLLRSSPKW